MKEKLQQELKDLYKAFKAGYLTTNEYQDIYYATAQRIKKLKEKGIITRKEVIKGNSSAYKVSI